ncbi:MAG: hypothetical protein CMP23_05105 [Rickettsiales bacterium]|nr:hypothetical protein [Rickettsiales bacterium]
MLLLFAQGCGGAQRSQTPIAVVEPVPEELPTGESKAPAWLPDGQGGSIVDPQSGFSIRLPEEWTWRRGSGSLLVEARSAGPSPTRLAMSSWEPRSAAELSGESEPLRFAARGPYTGLERIADRPPSVLTVHQPGRRIELSWVFVVAGRGLRLDARLAEEDFEAAFIEVDAIVRSAVLVVGEGPQP